MLNFIYCLYKSKTFSDVNYFRQYRIRNFYEFEYRMEWIFFKWKLQNMLNSIFKNDN